MQKQIWRFVSVFAVLALCIWGGWYVGTKNRVQNNADRVQVVATFFPLADFARSVGSDQVEVTQLTPDGVEVHEYEPSSQDVAAFLSADVVLVNGGGVDAWAEKLIPDAKAAGVKVVLMSEVVPFIESKEDHEEEDGHEEEDAHGHEGTQDPHAWLDLARAQEMVRALAEALIAQDPAHTATYATNADDMRTKLAALDASFTNTLETCTSRTVFVAHDAFSYWELRYNMHIESISGISPESEPSVQDLAKLVEQARAAQVTTIFFESPASTALATTLAQEVGAQAKVLSPLEGRTAEEIQEHATYLTIMQKNLSALAEALTCKTN